MLNTKPRKVMRKSVVGFFLCFIFLLPLFRVTNFHKVNRQGSTGGLIAIVVGMVHGLRCTMTTAGLFLNGQSWDYFLFLFEAMKFGVYSIVSLWCIYQE